MTGGQADPNVRWAFAFVDLAGFTALTETHGDDLAAAQVERFYDLTRGALDGAVVLVKSMGDAVMLAGADGTSVLRSTYRVMQACLAEPDFPVPRAGVHAGPAKRTGEDFVGMAVNVAARVAARAAGGQLLLTGALRQEAEAEGLEPVPMGRVHLRNVREAVEVFLLQLLPSDQALVDPVCRMRVATDTAAGYLRHRGATWWFCSLGCAATFARQPDAYGGSAGAPE